MIILQIFLAWLYSHILEYCLHRWLLHKKISKIWFKYHWSLHHKNARQWNMIDSKYNNIWNLYKDDEVIGLSLLALIHLPVFFFFPWAYAVLVFSAISYYFIHRRAHTVDGWGRSYLPWHYDHHMGTNQNMNWGVRLPFLDMLFKTRLVYKGTKREKTLKFRNKRRRARD